MYGKGKIRDRGRSLYEYRTDGRIKKWKTTMIKKTWMNPKEIFG